MGKIKLPETSLDHPGLLKLIPGFTYETIPQLLDRKASECGQKEFVIYEDESYTFEETRKISNKIAHALMALGIAKEDRVALMLPNCSEHVFSFLGITKAGAIEVAVNIDMKDAELSYVLNHSEARIIITDDELISNVRAISDQLEYLETMICIKPVEGALDFWELVEQAKEDTPAVAIAIDDVATLIYTSGSTGFPKGVLITHRYNDIYGALTDYSYRLAPKDRVMLITPLFHGVALWHGVMGALYMGLPCIVIRRFSATKFWDETRRYKATLVYAVGAIPAMLYHQPPTDRDLDNPVRFIWAFMCPAHILEAFEERFGVAILDGLGQTECGRVQINYLPVRKPGSLGLPYEFSDIKLVDNDDNEVGVGEVGEICVKAPCIMLGYYKNPEATAEAFKNGWLHTGDNGRMDEDGYCWFVDRKKDVIRRRGKLIASFEVQNIINTHPKVLESACIAVPSELAEEEVLAVIVPRDALDLPQPEEIAQWCKERMTYYKVPRFYVYRDSLPKTPSLRIQKHILRQQVTVDEAVEIPVTKEGEAIKRRVK